MSAIAGVVADDGGPLDPDLATRLIAAAPVRGFDGIGVWREGPACLIRHHHATTPQAVGETQPLPGPGGEHVLLFDGRIDNRAEVIALLARADCAKDAPDAMLALGLFERFGMDCVARLVGDWALAVWDVRDRSLFLARSPLGWRPLVWSHANGRFAFATDARTLLRGLDLDHTPDEGMIGEILSMRPTTRAQTPWRAVREVEQGHAMHVRRGAIRRWHWHTPPHGIDERLSDDDHIDRFLTLFDQAVEATSRSNTQVSAHLSGGLDSSSVVTRAIALHRAGRIARPVQAISARFPGMAQDETRWSRAVEVELGITARVTAAEPYSLDAAQHWVAETYHLPVRPNVFDTSTAAFRLMEREGSRVLLTGEGGDDWMGGGVEHLADLFRTRRFATLLREGITQYPGDALSRRLMRTAYWSIMPMVSRRHRRWLGQSHLGPLGPALPPWIRPGWARAIGLAERGEAARPSVTFASHVQQLRYTNFDNARRAIGYGNVLVMAEGHGVELRHPFHDLRLTHFFMTAAPRMITRKGLRKIVLREAMRGSLAESVRTRRDKAYFTMAITAAVRERLRARPVETLLPVTLGWLDADALRTMAARLPQSDAGDDAPVKVGLLWLAVSMDIWLAQAAGV